MIGEAHVLVTNLNRRQITDISPSAEVAKTESKSQAESALGDRL